MIPHARKLYFLPVAQSGKLTRDAWITGKIETMYLLNPHLNSFAINTDVESGIVMLSGLVESDIDRDLAGELAKGTADVVEVKNQLKIEPTTTRQEATAREEKHDGDRSFGK